MKPTNQYHVGPMTICKRKNEIGMSSMKRRTAVNIAKRIKAIVSSKSSANSSSSISEECDSGAGFCSRQALIQNYLNFKRSGAPSRFMFFRGGAWNDFSAEVFELLRASFVADVPVVECPVEGSAYLFDFFRMLQIDLGTGSQWSIAWIDDNGKCFFPKLAVGEEDGNACEVASCPKLEIEVRIQKDFAEENDRSSNAAKEQSGESPSHDLEIPKNPCLIEPCLESETPAERPRWPSAEILKEGDGGYMGIKNIFLSGIRRFSPDATVTSIYRCLHSGSLGSARLKAFQSQIEMTKAARGSANVRLAWFGTAAEGVASIITHGFGQPSGPPSTEFYGFGIYLSPQHLSHMSAALSSDDGNGERHVILCRVIMGNAEKVDAGSVQFHPSSEEYDCGVDNLVNPRWYIVWGTHMNRFILPEYVVSFRSPDGLQGLSRAMPSSNPSLVSFPKLLSEVEKYLPSSRNQALGRLYAQYKAAKLSKDTFVRQIRLIAGDKLLISTIHRIRGF